MHAFIVVDLQNDFMPGGALAVPEADQVVGLVNLLMGKFNRVVATQDWHPNNHGSFFTEHPGHKIGDVIDLHGLPQVLWPPHCVQQTAGAEFHPDLQRDCFDAVFKKGMHVNVDSYSGFFDNGRRHDTGLANDLRQHGIERVYVAGVATDYCVKLTALDSAALHFETYVIQDACRGVGLKPGDIEQAISDMQAAGVRIIQSDEVAKG